MESINLNGENQQQWVKEIIKNIIIYAINISLALTFTAFILYQSLDNKSNLLSAQNRNSELSEKLANLENSILALKNNQTTDSITLDRESLFHFIEIINHIPLTSGGIEIINIYYDDREKLKLVGKLKKSNDFSQLEEYLRDKNFHIDTEYFQTIENNLYEFSLIIYLNKETSK